MKKKRVLVIDVGGSDRKSTRLNSSHLVISYAVFCLKKKESYPNPIFRVWYPLGRAFSLRPTPSLSVGTYDMTPTACRTADTSLTRSALARNPPEDQ